MPDYGLSRGFVHYESRTWSFGPVIHSSKLGEYLIDRFNRATHRYYTPGRRNATEMNRRILEWLSQRAGRPFFVFVNFFDAHEPYVAPAEYDRRFLATEPPTRTSRERRLTAEELRGMRDAYDGTIAYLDDQLGILLREMSSRGELANTLVIITSDHGEEFGEHGWVSHGNGLYYPGLHVPLVISFPGRVPGGVRVSDGVTLRDLPATALDLVGLGARAAVPGRSWAVHWSANVDSSGVPPSPLLSELKRPRNLPSWYAVAKGDMQSIIVGQHHYIRNADGREELFDVVTDPWETTDLSTRPESRIVLETTRAALALAMNIGVKAPVANSSK
jgi:arylsulfatase A-like enzyme